MQTVTADAINSRNKQMEQTNLSRKFQENKGEGEKNGLQSKMQTDTADAAQAKHKPQQG